MYLDAIVRAQKQGAARGITAICSAHPWVLKTAMQEHPDVLLIESTCNQVNQYGGYTGLVPSHFVRFVRQAAGEHKYPFEDIILGGDHLGPSVWQTEPAAVAMQKAEVMVRDYVQAGFLKIHLDCSMPLLGDPAGKLDVEVSAARTAWLAKAAEESGGGNLRYVIGTEVPTPGGVRGAQETVGVTRVEDARQTIQVTRAAFFQRGLQAAWDRVVAVVVQPGVEFGDDFILPYQEQAAQDLSRFIESQFMICEAHSTDYQAGQALKNLVRDHFAILKVGPALTFAFREAVVALALIEQEVIADGKRSNILQVLDQAMLKVPQYWENYYRGDDIERARKRRYSLSDRARYYWAQAEVQDALTRLINNLGRKPLPYSLSSQFAGETGLTAEQVIESRILRVLKAYWTACDGEFKGPETWQSPPRGKSI